jgi:hypothetical protein
MRGRERERNVHISICRPSKNRRVVKDINACDRDIELSQISSFNINFESYSKTEVDLAQTQGFLMCPSPNYQPGDEGLLAECGTIV